MRVLIVEDETAASENLVAMLKGLDASIDVLGVLESVQQVMRWLDSHPEPDLIFMDIHLSDGLSFTLFDHTEVKTPIIFTTAYDQYALEAFNVNSIDYLLKPLKVKDLKRALDKFNRWTQPDVAAYVKRMLALKTSTPKEEYKKAFLVPVRDKLIPVDLDDVACIYSSERSTMLYLKDGKTMPYSKSLDAIAASLDPKHFIRANKQYIVSKSAIKDIVVWFDSRLLVRLPVELPEPIYVSKNKASEFKSWMTDH
ncbi:MAG: response regulator transcription factor [Bacteroidaceae bacterium]|nr:response regulator transcription factor [Bacteroidaceae bacterium]